MEQEQAAYSFVVVDNGSKTNCRTSLQNWLTSLFSDFTLVKESNKLVRLPSCIYLLLDKNYGYARGNNAGFKLTLSDNTIKNVLFLNNDIIFKEAIIDKLYATQQHFKDHVAIVAPLMLKRDRKSIDFYCAKSAITKHEIMWLYFLLSLENLAGILSKFGRDRYVLKKNLDKIEKKIPIAIEVISGSCFLVNKALFERIDCFDPHTFLYYEEDILCEKIKREHLTSYISTDCSCIHLGGDTTKVKGLVYTMRCGMNSASYFIKTYLKPNKIERFLLKPIFGLANLHLYIILFVRSTIKRNKE